MRLHLRTTAVTIAAIAGFLFVAAPAQAELAAGVLEGPGNGLVTLDTAAPQQFGMVRQITGLQSNEDIVGIAYRINPIGAGATPTGLFGLGIADAGASDTARLYRIDQGTGAATLVGAPIAGLDDGTDYGVAYNSASDRVRVVSDADENLRINPNTAIRSDSPVNDLNLTPGGVDIEAVAYDRVDSDPNTSTTLFALNAADDTLSRIGGVNGAPSPNGGAVTALGPTVNSSGTGSRNFDIAPGGTAFATVVDNLTGAPGIYSLNLGTGAATLIGTLPGTLRAFAVVPAATVQFADAAAGVSEGSAATVTVVRGGATSGTASVEYQAMAESASGADFGAASGTLTFAPEEASKTIAIPTTDDALEESDETVTIALSDPGPTTTTGTPSTATLTIADDDSDDACTKAKAKLKKAKKKLAKLKDDGAKKSAIEKAAEKVKKLKKKMKKACR